LPEPPQHMNKEQLIAWLKEYDITIADCVPQEGGEVLIFMGRRPLPWAGEPRWASIAVKHGQTRVATKEIESLLRHFCHAELTIPRAKATAASAQNFAVQPLQSELPVSPAPKPKLEN
jgi:hypothetical protein